MVEHWLLLKRGLFYRPGNCGYTGIRNEAGRYSRKAADEHAAAGGRVMREADAPEFLPAAFDDLVIKHLTVQRDALVKALTDAQRIIERDFPNGQLAIDIRTALINARVGQAAIGGEK